jgi:hypothetical protein
MLRVIEDLAVLAIVITGLCSGRRSRVRSAPTSAVPRQNNALCLSPQFQKLSTVPVDGLCETGGHLP